MTIGYSLQLYRCNREAPQHKLGVRLGKLCIEKNISVDYVSDKLNVSRQTIYNWFMGLSEPQRRHLTNIERFLASLNK